MHQIALGEYSIVLDGGRVGIDGPDASVCENAENALFALLGTDHGARLLGLARLGASTGAGQSALSRIAESIGVPFDPTRKPPPARPNALRALDYDDDHSRIRALNLPKIYTRTITEFEGMCAALVFDGVVDDAEIGMLKQWMQLKAEFLGAWPLCDVKELLDHALRDGFVDEGERRALLELLESIGASAEDCGKAAGSIFDDNPSVEFPQRSFLFTGRLAMGKRKDAETAVAARGGKAAQSVTHRLDYLVVGDLGTDAWQYSRYGRKIEAVMENKRAGAATLILREADFALALEQRPSV